MEEQCKEGTERKREKKKTAVVCVCVCVWVHLPSRQMGRSLPYFSFFLLVYVVRSAVCRRSSNPKGWTPPPSTSIQKSYDFSFVFYPCCPYTDITVVKNDQCDWHVLIRIPLPPKENQDGVFVYTESWNRLLFYWKTHNTQKSKRFQVGFAAEREASLVQWLVRCSLKQIDFHGSDREPSDQPQQQKNPQAAPTLIAIGVSVAVAF